MSSDSSARQFDVILLGFHQIQRTIIGSLCTLSRQRATSFRVIANSDLFAADIILIDLHDEMVIENWEQLREVLGGIPVLFVGESKDEDTGYWLKRSDIAAQLLTTFDRIVLEQDLEPGKREEDVPVSHEAPIPVEQEIEEITLETPVTELTDEDTTLNEDDAELTAEEIHNFGYGQMLDSPDPFDDDYEIAEEDTIILSGGLPLDGQPDIDATSEDASSLSQPDLASAEIDEPAPVASVRESATSLPATPNPRFSKKRIISDEDAQYDHKVLVVDDSVTVWAQMRACLATAAVDVDFIQTAEAGIELTKTRKYALVFMDVVLPGMDGYSACKVIKTDDITREVPVVMMTSKSAPANKVRGVLSGCSYYMTKPVDESEVSAVMQRFVPACRTSASYRAASDAAEAQQTDSEAADA